MKDEFPQIVIVLDRPQDASNVGAVVRAMMNMGLSQLRLVRPCAFDPQRIEVVAHRSAEIVAQIRFYDSVAEAVADAVYVLATSARLREPGLPVFAAREAAGRLLSEAERGTVAILFGPEDQGLPRDTLALCHALIQIPTVPDYHSLNLAQAVLLVAYELRLAWEATAAQDMDQADVPGRDEPLATVAAIEDTMAALEIALWRIQFLKQGQADATLRTLRHLVQRAQVTEREVALLKAIGVEIVKFLQRQGV